MNNFKTTFLGMLIGALNLYANGVSVKQALVSSAIIAFGTVSKDYNVTGGTKQAVDMDGFNKIPTK